MDLPWVTCHQEDPAGDRGEFPRKIGVLLPQKQSFNTGSSEEHQRPWWSLVGGARIQTQGLLSLKPGFFPLCHFALVHSEPGVPKHPGAANRPPAPPSTARGALSLPCAPASLLPRSWKPPLPPLPCATPTWPSHLLCVATTAAALVPQWWNGRVTGLSPPQVMSSLKSGLGPLHLPNFWHSPWHRWVTTQSHPPAPNE